MEQKGNALQILGRYQESLQAYDKAIELDPRLGAAWNDKGNSLRNLERYNEALDAYDRAIHIDRRLTAALINKGNILSHLGRYSESAQAYDKAMELNEKYADVYERADNRSFDDSPIESSTWIIKGLALEQDDQEGSLEAYDRATVLSPENALAWCCKGDMLCLQDRQEEAVKAMTRQAR
jgi:superkiller protein 3